MSSWYPLKMTYEVRAYAFGDRLIPDMLGKTGTPDGVVAETWEVSDYRDARATVLNGVHAGRPFHDLVMEHPREIVGENWSGPQFPLLAKFLDASHPLPVHLHADDETAARIYGEPNGKTESWHILWAEPGSTILAGVKPSLEPEDLVAAFKRQDYGAVMFQYPIASGDTVYVPGGVLHSFGPNTLIFEIQQTSDLGQHVMPIDLYGNQLSEAEWDSGIDRTLAELRTGYLPAPNQGLVIERNGNFYRIGSAGPHFALERWSLRSSHHELSRPDRCLVVSNVGDPVTLQFEAGEEELKRAESCVIPAAIGVFEIEPTTTGDLIVCYLPDLARDVIQPLLAAGYGDEEINALGEVGPV